MNRSVPSRLKSQHPDVDDHQSLLEWLTGKHSEDGARFFGAFHGVLQSTDDFTNGIMVLLYSADSENLATFSADEMKKVVGLLQGQQNYLNQSQLGTLQEMLNASTQTMDAFAHFKQQPPAPPRPGRRGP